MDQMSKIILLVEDNPDDAKLTLRAFQRSNMANPVVVVRDGVEALDFLFARGAYAERAGKPLPTLIILDLKLPKIDGLGVLRAVRVDERTRLIPVVFFTSSTEELFP
jgi:two-component system response regulator